MKMNRAVLTAVVFVVLAAAGWYMFRRGSAERIDLLERYDQAEKKGGAFNVADATLAGETKRAISAPANGRLTFRERGVRDRKSTRLNSSHRCISYAVFCLKKKKVKRENSISTTMKE